MKGGVLRDARGRVRSGWRIALWLLLAGVALLTVRLAVHAAGLARLEAVAPALWVAALAVVSLITWRAVDDRPPGRTPLAPTGTALRAFGLGALGGVLAVALVVGTLVATGAYRVASRACELGDQAAFAGRWLGIFLFAAAVEELVFRGYPLFALRDGLGRPTAALVTAVLFALAHAGNPHFGWPAGIVIVWIGFLLAAWVLATGTLWGAFGIHLGWNWAQAAGAALPASGLSLGAPCYTGVLEGPGWLTGGSFGIEASVLAAVVWGSAGGAVWVVERRRRRAARGLPSQARSLS